MEQDRAVMAKRVQRLQEAVKNQKKVLCVLLSLRIVYMLYYHYVLCTCCTITMYLYMLYYHYVLCTCCTITMYCSRRLNNQRRRVVIWKRNCSRYCCCICTLRTYGLLFVILSTFVPYVEYNMNSCFAISIKVLLRKQINFNTLCLCI